MKQSISNFLQFNNTNVLFTSVDGVTYVAIKPICQALNVDYSGQLMRVKNDPLLGSEYGVYHIQVGNLQGRKYTCISEKYIYGWIFSINSTSPEFLEFKKECYELLYNHFHGVIGRRKELLLGQAEVALKIDQLKTKLYESADYKQLIELEAKKKIYSKEMSKVDQIVINQSEIKFE
ncbi:phage antirepressor N-terminal domain-containing protein [Flavobacterium sp.]|jgi:hypothetical protein|uniref:phage antirepressor N-terminal domain-containing protein n=1 Tax=Flavobacterium sp. TaxID=239 RepID=UPI0037BEB3D7